MNSKITDIKYIRVENIIITQQIEKTILKYNPLIKIKNKIIFDDSLPLSRMKSMLDDSIYKSDYRPPINVLQENNNFYITNGRHRVTRAILLGHKFINCKISKKN